MSNILRTRVRVLLSLIAGGIFLVTCAAARVEATTVVIPSDDEMIVGARAIIRGEVLDRYTRFDPQRGMVFSYITVDVTEVWKGAITSKQIVLKIPGGVAGEVGTIIHGVPEFETGEQVVLFLDTWADGSLKVHHWFLGKYRLEENRTSGKIDAVRSAPSTSVFVRGRSPFGTVTDGMQVEAFAEKVRNKVASLAAYSALNEARYYQGVPLRSSPPELEVAKGDSPLAYRNYTFIYASPPRWFESDSSQPVMFNISATPKSGQTLPASVTPDQLVSDILNAMGAWSAVSNSNLRVTSGGQATGCGFKSNDGSNITFNDCDGFFSASGTCSGILAAGGITLYDTSISKGVNGTKFYRASEGDVSFNPYANCYFTSRCRVQEVLTHEIGHALGLGHSEDTNATMYAIAHSDGRCASLGVDDAAAIRFIYPSN